MNPLVSAIVVSYNSAHVLDGCLERLKAQGIAAIVVDNASSDDTVQICQKWDALLVANDRNEGFGRAMNIGAQKAKTDWLLLINPDAWVEDDFWQQMLDAMTRFPDAQFFAPRILEDDGRHFYAHSDWCSPFLQNKQRVKWVIEGDCCVPSVSGACMLVRRKMFEKLGGFDKNLFLFFEDNDLCRQFSLAGAIPYYVHGAVVRHGRGKSSLPSVEGTQRVRWHMAWSRHYVESKYGLLCTAEQNIKLLRKKLFWARLIFQKHKIIRYQAGIAGSKAWLDGITALQRESLV